MQNNIQQIMHNIECAKQKFGRTDSVHIVAASKCQSFDDIAQAIKLGVHAAGENRVQEFLSKYRPNSGFEWHFIGALQRNKVKYIIDKVSLIQSIDSTKLAEEVNRQALLHGITMSSLIEVNIGGEAQKSGVSPLQLDSLVDYVLQLPNIKLCGLMCVMPQGAHRELYTKMYNIYKQTSDRLRDESFSILSMGMSEDYVTAVECGANMVRLGTAIFGKRVIKG